MAPNSNLHYAHLYDIAQQAQAKAERARRRKRQRSRRTATPQSHMDSQLKADTPQRATLVSPSQHRGLQGENRAAQYLHEQGLRVLARNVHCRTGEIDLIATEQNTLVFVEVRLRVSRQFGGAAASVNPAKQRRLARTARYLLPQLRARFFNGHLPVCRFDVICIDNNQLHWIKHAFDIH